jgi:hypothetical protein
VARPTDARPVPVPGTPAGPTLARPVVPPAGGTEARARAEPTDPIELPCPGTDAEPADGPGTLARPTDARPTELPAVPVLMFIGRFAAPFGSR